MDQGHERRPLRSCVTSRAIGAAAVTRGDHGRRPARWLLSGARRTRTRRDRAEAALLNQTALAICCAPDRQSYAAMMSAGRVRPAAADPFARQPVPDRIAEAWPSPRGW